MPLITVDSLSVDVDAAEVAMAVAAARGGQSDPSPKGPLMLMARKVAADAERVAAADEGSLDEQLAIADQEMAVIAHLGALVGHVLGRGDAAYATDTSAILVEALIATERQNVCGYARSDAFCVQLDVMAKTLATVRRRTRFNTVVLVAGEIERLMPDYESYMSIAKDSNVEVIEVDPAGGVGAVIALVTQRLGGLDVAEYL